MSIGKLEGFKGKGPVTFLEYSIIVLNDGSNGMDEDHKENILYTEEGFPHAYVGQETKAWFDRIYLGEPTPHTTAAEGHDNLMLCLAMDRSAHKGVAIHLPIEPKDLEALR